jgi:iron complex transport system ATP-binding protein
MVARVLAQDTDIMIMDEPTAFLDVRNKFEMIYLLHELSQGKGKTIIFSTHDLNIAISKADKIWLTNNDSLYEGAPEDLMINGSFDHLFDSSVIGFNKTDGNFSFKSKDRGPVFVEGKGTNKHWTEKAIIRSGFSLSEERCDWVIKVIEGEAKGWQVNIPGKSMEFPSIYELIDWLSFEKNQAI